MEGWGFFLSFSAKLVGCLCSSMLIACNVQDDVSMTQEEAYSAIAARIEERMRALVEELKSLQSVRLEVPSEYTTGGTALPACSKMPAGRPPPHAGDQWKLGPVSHALQRSHALAAFMHEIALRRGWLDCGWRREELPSAHQVPFGSKPLPLHVL